MSVTETKTAAPPAPRGVLVLLIPLMLVLFISTLDQTIVATALSGIGRSLGGARNESWVASAYLLTSAITTLIFGKLGDMYGRKKIFQMSIAIFVAGSLLCGVAPSMGLLIGFRALQGIGGGGLNSLVQAITGDLFPARQRAKYQAAMGIVAALGVVAGPLLGGLFVDQLSWRWIFFINVPIGIVAIAIVAARLHLTVRRPGGSVDLAGGALAVVFTTAVLLVTVWGGTGRPWTSPAILGLITLSVLALAGYVLAEHHAAEPITPLILFRNGIFTVSSLLFAVAALVLFAAMLYVPAMLQGAFGYSAFTAGLFLIPLLVGLISATAVSGGLITKTGRYKIYPIIGTATAGTGMFGLSLVTVTTPAWVMIVWLALTGAGLGFLVQVCLLAGQNSVDGSLLGVATGALNFFKTLGGAFGAALFGAILTSQLIRLGPVPAAQTIGAYQGVFLWCVPFMAFGLLLALLMKEKPLSEEMIDAAAGRAEIPEY